MRRVENENENEDSEDSKDSGGSEDHLGNNKDNEDNEDKNRDKSILMVLGPHLAFLAADLHQLALQDRPVDAEQQPADNSAPTVAAFRSIGSIRAMGSDSR